MTLVGGSSKSFQLLQKQHGVDACACRIRIGAAHIGCRCQLAADDRPLRLAKQAAALVVVQLSTGNTGRFRTCRTTCGIGNRCADAGRDTAGSTTRAAGHGREVIGHGTFRVNRGFTDRISPNR